MTAILVIQDMLISNNLDNQTENTSMNVVTEQTGVSTLIGTPQEIQAQLGTSSADQVLVIAFAHVDGSALQTLVQNISNVASSMFSLFQQQQDRDAIERLAAALVPPVPVSARVLKQAAMLVKARKAVLESGNWLTAAEVATLAGLSTTNPSAQPNKWKKQRQIFAIHHNGVDYFPDYGLDRESNFRPLKAMTQVLEVFAGHNDGWGLAFWFLSANSFLAGQSPQELLRVDPERVLAAARDEVQGVVHG